MIKEKLLLSASGVLTGAVNGFFGGGGGMITVPALTLLLGYPQRKAHAATVFAVLPITVVSGLIYAIYGCFPLAEGIPAALGAVAGGAIGAVLLGKIPTSVLVYVFAALTFAAGVKMLFF